MSDYDEDALIDAIDDYAQAYYRSAGGTLAGLWQIVTDRLADHDAEVEHKAKVDAERKYRVLRGRFEALRDEYDQRQSPPWSQAVANLIDRELNRDE